MQTDSSLLLIVVVDYLAQVAIVIMCQVDWFAVGRTNANYFDLYSCEFSFLLYR